MNIQTLMLCFSGLLLSSCAAFCPDAYDPISPDAIEQGIVGAYFGANEGVAGLWDPTASCPSGSGNDRLALYEASALPTSAAEIVDLEEQGGLVLVEELPTDRFEVGLDAGDYVVCVDDWMCAAFAITSGRVLTVNHTSGPAPGLHVVDNGSGAKLDVHDVLRERQTRE